MTIADARMLREMAIDGAMLAISRATAAVANETGLMKEARVEQLSSARRMLGLAVAWEPKEEL